MAGKHDHGEKAERKSMKFLGAKPTIASGRLDGDKGDGKLPGYLLENKATVHGSFSLKHRELAKISGEAEEKNCDPLLTFQFVNHEGDPKKDGSWVCIPARVWRELLLK